MNVKAFNPFDSNKKSSSVVLQQAGQTVTYVKGAPEKIIERCSHYLNAQGERKELTERRAINAYMDKQAGRSMRLLAVAKADGEKDDENLTLVCVLSIRDNVRKEAIEAIHQVQNAGVQVVMVTGDRKETAVAIAKELGVPVKFVGLGEGIDDLKPFVAEEKVIEYLLEAEDKKKRLVDMTCKAFAEETASESPAPGGGSISAYMGALGAALGTMVANLSSHKAGWDDRWEEFSDWADRGQILLSELLHLVDEDTAAFNRIMAVFAMPKSTDEEKAARSAALQEATLYATEVPLRTMETSFKAFDIVRAMAEEGNPNSVSDAGVGALAIRSAVMGACLNVKINAAGLKDRQKAEALIARAEQIVAQAQKAEAEILAAVESKIQ